MFKIIIVIVLGYSDYQQVLEQYKLDKSFSDREQCEEFLEEHSLKGSSSDNLRPVATCVPVNRSSYLELGY